MSTPSRYCATCGTPLPHTASFCTSCGERVASASADPVAPVAQTTASGPTVPPRSQGGGRRRLLIGASVAVLAVAGGGVAALKLTGGGAAETLDGTEIASAVTSEPEEAWTFDTDVAYAVVTTSGDTTIVSNGDSGEIVALDRDGEELWRAGGGDDYYGYGYVLPDSDLVLVQGMEDYGVGVVSLEDGEELWFDESGGRALGLVGDALAVSSSEEEGPSELSLVDLESGEVRWSVSDVDSSVSTDDAVFVVAGEELKRLSASGEEEWSVSLEVGEDEYPSVTAVEGMVAVSTDEVTAYSTDDGEELWSEAGGGEDASIYANAFTADLLYLDESTYDGEQSAQTITVFDAEGERGELDIDEEGQFYGYGLEAGGTSYFLNTGDPSLYNEDLERLDTYDGEVVAADEGVYSLDGDTLRFYTFEDSSAAWEIDVDSGSEEDSASLYAGDGVVYVLADSQLTAYR